MTHSPGILFFFVFLLNTNNFYPQNTNQPPKEFGIGAILSGKTTTNKTVHTTFRESGMNIIVEHAGSDNKNLLSHYELIPFNQGKGEWIHYYATGLYSKWEAEEDQKDKNAVGVKHKNGKEDFWKNTRCWSISGVQGPLDSVMYGPHYRQEKAYKRWGGNIPVNYIARYRMALNNNGTSGDADVCRITVRVRHVKFINGVWNRRVYDDTLAGPLTLKVSDFPADNSFKEFYFGNSQHRTYSYLPRYPEKIDKRRSDNKNIVYKDSNPDNGVEFCLEWLGSSRMTLYIDNVEVYDDNGWNKYIENPQKVADSIQAYAKRFFAWPNIKYWYAHDEPNSRDAFIPMHTVDNILESVNAAPLITHFYAGSTINGEDLLDLFYKIAQPKKLLIDIYPFSPSWNPVRWEDLEGMQKKFQKASELDPNFYYTPQAFGYWDLPKNKWEVWRRPDSSELKVTVMLAIAHGAKGMIFSDYDSYPITSSLIDSAIVGTKAEHFEKQDLWYLIHNNFVPRLSGKLGQRLTGLRYTGDFINLRNYASSNSTQPQTIDYLTLSGKTPSDNMNWHAGLFVSQNNDDDKYFFLVNLIPDAAESVTVKLTPPTRGFKNYRFKNYEGYFDTTFTGSVFTYMLTHPAGEGYLYEIAPVVKYGGKLYTDEIIINETLYNDMIIEDDVTLRIKGTYECYGSIYIRGKGKIKIMEGGSINFHKGNRIFHESRQ